MSNKTVKMARKMVRTEIAKKITGAEKVLQAQLRAPWRWFEKDKSKCGWLDIKNFPAKQHRYKFRFVDRIEAGASSFDR